MKNNRFKVRVAEVAVILTIMGLCAGIGLPAQNEVSGSGKARLDSVITIVQDQGSGSWNVHRKREYQYNDNGKMIRSATDYFDYDENGWVHSRKGEYQWDSLGKMVEGLFFKKVQWSPDLIPYDREQLVYDENGRLSQLFRQKLDGNAWVYYEKEEYEYDNHGLLYRLYTFRFGETSEWDRDEMQEYTIDSLGRFDYTTYSEYGAGTYHVRYAMEYTYASNNDLAELTFLEAIFEGFAPVFKQVYTYQDPGFNDLTIPHLFPFEQGFFNHRIVESDSLSWAASSLIFVKEARDLYYYSGIPLGVADPVRNPGIRIYPNPTPDRLKIEFGNTPGTAVRLDLLDTGGRLVRSERKTLSGDSIELAVGDLDPGLYILRVTLPDRNYSARIAVE